MGPIKNGGIGTHCYYLARFLREELNHDVTILFTSSISESDLRPWIRRYSKERDIRLVGLRSTLSWPRAKERPSYPILRRSLQVYDWLKEQDFDVCHFEDWQPEGFAAIQAKRTGQAFSRTCLTLMMHSSSEWTDEGALSYPTTWTRSLAHGYMSRYCAQYADLLLSPTQYMFDWAQANDWTLQTNRRVVPLLFDLPVGRPPDPKPFAGEHLIFFGRLETRKGLVVFVKALRALASRLEGRQRPLQVTFLGRNGFVGTQRATDYLAAAMKPINNTYNWRVVSDLGQPEGLRFLAEHADALVVVPSLSDNSPYAVIESLQLNANLIASCRGGIPELVESRECLFEPTPAALTTKLLQCLRDGAPEARSRYQADEARAAWRAVHDANVAPSRTRMELRSPKVSVCMPHYNHGEFLPTAIESVARQTYTNLEVIVVDDGSTDVASLETFRWLQKRYPQPQWRFFEKANGYLGQTRNFAACRATGEYLVFVDADNVATPQMVERMVCGMETSGAACLTCHSLFFTSDLARRLSLWDNRYAPLGPCLELAVYENIIGDANFIVRRDVFERMQGFTEEREDGCEDWEFLMKLASHDLIVDVIPEPLFLYRRTQTSMARTMNRYTSHQRALRPILHCLPPWQKRFLTNAVGTFCTNTIVPRCPDAEADSDGPVSSDDSETLRHELAKVQARLDKLKASPVYQLGRWWYYTKRRFTKRSRSP
jgi:GT2 family glycosyltransferase